ncbi:MAG: hypothetical protein ACYDBS_01620 [Acidimicrobiales bacterium]
MLPAVLAGGSAAVLTQLPVEPAGAATGGCAYNYASGFDGFQSRSGTESANVDGVTAYITSRIGDLCVNYNNATKEADNNFSSAWAMLTGNPGDGGAETGYAQSGYQYYPYQGLGRYNTVFGQWMKRYCSTCIFHNDFTLTIDHAGTNYKFWTYVDSNGEIHDGYTDASGTAHELQNSGTWDVGTGNAGCDSANHYAWCSNFGELYFGEAYDLNDDMPGTSSSLATFYDMQTYNASSNSWTNRLWETMDGYVTASSGDGWDRSGAIDFSGSTEPDFSIWTNTP